MPNQVTEYKCLLISPSDVTAERDALTELISLWNAHSGKGLNARIDLVRWESHSVPDMAMPAQEAINKQLVDDCDFGIAVFWYKLGTKTKEHPSGSVEEIYRLLQKQARVMVYFCSRDVPQAALQDDQYPRLQEIKKKFGEEGLYAGYSDIPSLRERVNIHLTSIVSELQAKNIGTTPFTPSAGSMTAPTPDVRVIANPHFVTSLNPADNRVSTYLGVEVQNHSPVTVYLTSVGFETKDGRTVLTPQDPVTGERLPARKELNSGQSYTLFVDPSRLKEFKDNLVCAKAVDQVGRVYRSKSEFFPMIIKDMV